MVNDKTNNSQKTFHILCSTDDNFAQHCGVMIKSLFLNENEHRYIIHVLENKLSEESRQKLLEITKEYNHEIKFHHIDETYAKELKVHKDCSTSDEAYYRLLVCSVLTDKSIERILYLDCDVIVKSSLSALFFINIDDYSLAAVRDMNNPVKENHQFSLSFSYRERYFNSGIILINLKKWRENNYQDLLLKKAKELNSKTYPDQDPLNAVFRDQWLELPPCWNRFNVVKYRDVYFKNKADELEFIYNPRIIHYASPAARPWMNMHFVPWGKDYEKILAKTPWKNTKKIKVETRARYKHLLKVKYSNFLYRSPLLIRMLVTSFVDCLLFVFHLIKHKSLRYYSPYRI